MISPEFWDLLRRELLPRVTEAARATGIDTSGWDLHYNTDQGRIDLAIIQNGEVDCTLACFITGDQARIYLNGMRHAYRQVVEAREDADRAEEHAERLSLILARRRGPLLRILEWPDPDAPQPTYVIHTVGPAAPPVASITEESPGLWRVTTTFLSEQPAIDHGTMPTFASAYESVNALWLAHFAEVSHELSNRAAP